MARNNNCLEHKRCPMCGQRDAIWFYGAVYGHILMGDSGTIEEKADRTDWEDNAPSRCPECSYEGPAWHFNLKVNQDEITVEIAENRTMYIKLVFWYGDKAPSVGSAKACFSFTWWLDSDGWNAYREGEDVPFHKSSTTRVPSMDFSMILMDNIFDEHFSIEDGD